METLKDKLRIATDKIKLEQLNSVEDDSIEGGQEEQEEQEEEEEEDYGVVVLHELLEQGLSIHEISIALEQFALKQLEDGQEEEENGVFIPEQHKLPPALEQLNALSRSIKRDEKIAPKPEGLQKEWLNVIKDEIHSFVSGLIPGWEKIVPVNIRMLYPYPMSGTVIHKPPNLSINPFSTSSKDIIQSYIVTTARYDFSVHEKRILYRIIECLQYQLKGKHLDKNFMISPDLYGMVRVTLPLSYLNPKKGKHISEDVKEALKTLQKKMIQYEDNGQCKEVKLIEPSIEQPLILGREVSFLLHQDAYELLLNFPKGFKRYELKTAMEFNSVYAMRFYELLSGQKKPLTYSTEKLKTMLKLENKYRDIRTFISRIIDHSKKELDQKSPYTFTYELEHEKERNQKGRKKISNIKFIPIYQPEHRNTDLALQEEQRSLDLSVALRPKELNIFLELGFSENELKTRHFVVIQDLHKAKEMDFRFPIFDMIDYVKKKENPRIYLITTLKNQIKEWKKKFQEQEENKLSEAAMKVKKERQRKQDKIIAFLQNCTTIPNSTFENEREQIIERIHDKGGILYLRKIYAACNGDKDRIMKKLMDNKIITK